MKGLCSTVRILTYPWTDILSQSPKCYQTFAQFTEKCVSHTFMTISHYLLSITDMSRVLG